MKQIFCLILLLLYSVGNINAIDTPVELKPPTDNLPYPRAQIKNRTIAVTATLNDTMLVLNFNIAVGLSTIIVTDDLGSVVYQQTIDTDSTSEIDIPVDFFDSGDYSIAIHYNTVKLLGYFTF